MQFKHLLIITLHILKSIIPLHGGKDHDASGRYIFTQLSPITRYLFDKDKDDEPIPHYLNDYGQSIEPAW